MRRVDGTGVASTLRVIRLFWCGLGFAAIVNAHAATFIVSTSSDKGRGSLRQAILNANAANGPATITFRIPGTGTHTISPQTPLPHIDVPIVIDGTTQPGYNNRPVIELNGSSVSQNPAVGLYLFGSNSLIRGLAINRFNGVGIQIEGPGGNIVRGNYIGTDVTGTRNLANGQQGIVIYSSPANVIGGTNAADRNLISGNGDAGVYLYGTGGNTVLGNFIGTAANGTNRLGNANTGITIFNSMSNRIGGSIEGARNVIAGNANSGIYLNGPGSTGNLIQGNYIGLNATGGLMLSNSGDGVTLFGAPGNLIGGTNPGARNFIAGNAKAGISLAGASATNNLVQGNSIGTDLSGELAVGNGYAGISAGSGASFNTIGGAGPGAGNLISGNDQDGLYLTNSAWNLIQGNWIGIDVTGKAALGNGFNGITFNAANSNLVGGTLAGAGNVISGNTNCGIYLLSGATSNLVQGNYIGTDMSARLIVSNHLSGLRLDSPGNTIGGGANGARNLISGNGQDGIFLAGTAASNNAVLGNFIGTDISGTRGLGNGRAGIGLSGAPGNAIGGTSTTEGNLISANYDYGIYLITSQTTGTLIQGNTIGGDITGTAPLGNWDGVYIESASTNTIGGTAPGAGNLVSGNLGRGIWLTNASWTLIQGNRIGTQSDGVSALGNSFHGVECGVGANNNLIGGVGSAGNRIAYSLGLYDGVPAYAGVRIRDGSSNNAILGNSIFGNGALGITLGATWQTPEPIVPCELNTAGRANLAQNFPLLSEAVTGNGTGIRGTLNSSPNSPYLLQFFANPARDPSGYAQGQIFVGELTVPTGTNCSGDFTAFFPTAVPAGYWLTSTATDAASNTSEFSACVPAMPIPAPSFARIVHAGGPGPSISNVLTLSWTNTGTYVLQQADGLNPPVRWAAASPPPMLTGSNQWVVTFTNHSGKIFYRLSFN